MNTLTIDEIVNSINTKDGYSQKYEILGYIYEASKEAIKDNMIEESQIEDLADMQIKALQENGAVFSINTTLRIMAVEEVRLALSEVNDWRLMQA